MADHDEVPMVVQQRAVEIVVVVVTLSSDVFHRQRRQEV